MRKIMAFLLVVIMVGAAVGVAIGAGGGLSYFGRWINGQYTYVPVEESIDVTTIQESVPDWVYPGDVYTLSYEVRNDNQNSSYEMLDTFQGNWQVIKQCSIKIVNTEGPAEEVLFQKTFSVNDTTQISPNEMQLMTEEMELIKKTAVGAGGSVTENYNYYCLIPYEIPAGATCRLEVGVKIRNDSPNNKETEENWRFWCYLNTYRGRDETPYWYDGMG